MICIYCAERDANAREHYLPQCLGRFRNFEPLLHRPCQICNQEIGNSVERDFCRCSPESVLRSTNWIKGQNTKKKRPAPKIFQPKTIGGRHLYFLAADPAGIEILWRPDVKPGTAKPISQIVVLGERENAVDRIPIPTEIQTGQELANLLKTHPDAIAAKVLVVAESGDEARIERLFSEIGHPVSLTDRTKGKLGQQAYRGEVGPAYFRGLAKIGFHYALKFIPTIIGDEVEFQPLREFIRKGTGDWTSFLTLEEPRSGFIQQTGHRLEASTRGGTVWAKMQFFVGEKPILPQWSLRLGSHPALVPLPRKAAHLFTYEEAEDGSLSGGNILVLHDATGVANSRCGRCR